MPSATHTSAKACITFSHTQTATSTPNKATTAPKATKPAPKNAPAIVTPPANAPQKQQPAARFAKAPETRANFPNIAKAAYDCNLKAVKTLITEGVDPNECAPGTRPAIVAAAVGGSEVMVETLIEAGANVHAM